MFLLINSCCFFCVSDIRNSTYLIFCVSDIRNSRYLIVAYRKSAELSTLFDLGVRHHVPYL